MSDELMTEARGASCETTLAIEQFLNDNYLFRRNVLNGKVEFVTKPADESIDRLDEAHLPDYRPLTQEALNSIIRRAKREEVCEKGSPRTEITEFVHSEDVPIHNPIGDYLKGLPAWNGQNHIGQLFSRLPGITSEQQSFLDTRTHKGRFSLSPNSFRTVPSESRDVLFPLGDKHIALKMTDWHL